MDREDRVADNHCITPAYLEQRQKQGLRNQIRDQKCSRHGCRPYYDSTKDEQIEKLCFLYGRFTLL